MTHDTQEAHTPSPGQKPPEKPPFSVSFLGLLIVLVAITTIATVGIPMWFAQPRITLQKAADLLASDLENVREWAILSHTDCRVDFDPDGGGYTAFDALGNPLSAPIGEGPFRRDYDVDAVFRGVTVETLNLGGSQTLTFDRRGLPRQGGTITLAYGGATRTVKVHRGLVKVLEATE